jgi:peptidyl-dipeptidase Dcp
LNPFQNCVMNIRLPRPILISGLFIFLLPPSFAQEKGKAKTAATMYNERIEASYGNNPLLSGWKGPHGGVPAFDKVKLEYFKPAIEIAITENLAEIDRIVTNKKPATFENTILPLERSGQALARVRTYYDIWSANMNSPEFEKIEQEIEPKLAELKDKINQNEGLFLRVSTVYNSPEFKKLTSEQQRLTWRRYTNFVLNGAKLDAKSKAAVAEINQRLSTLFAKFSQNLMGDEKEKFVEITNEADLDGLPEEVKSAAKSAAEARKLPLSWIISNTRSSVDPFLSFATNRPLREKVWRMFINRGDNADQYDNNGIITEILVQRARRAKLFGYATHAHWRLDNTMAKTPERAQKLMESVWKPAVQLVNREVADMQKMADSEGKGVRIEPWDYRFYAEKVRKQKYDLDQNEVKQYLQMEKLREGMFWVAGKLFGLSFNEVHNVPVFHPDVRVFQVTREASGKEVGLWYFDPFARPGKRSGAWMNAYREQHKMDGKSVTTIVSNNSNFIKGKPGEPVLISWDDAETLFHEFGHALHGLCSDATYPTLSGTNLPQDYVEFPSQVLEHWLATPEVLNKYALHYQTGKPMPATLISRIQNASKFNQGFLTVEAVSSALVDMKLHLQGEEEINPDSFERNTLVSLSMPSELVMRHRLPQFAHIFSSDEYSAGYYSYLWSDVLSADAWEAFTEAKGPYDPFVAKRLFDHVFSVGNTIDPEVGYKLFRGRDPKTDALMKDKGLTE